MAYSIGEVANATSLTVSTLRYYDREGLFPNMRRSSGGRRIFSDNEVNTIRVIECLKASGMPIKDIKQFLRLCQEGDNTLKARRTMFYERLQEVTKQMAALQNTMNTLRYKCWYYDTALQNGTEEHMQNLAEDQIPQDVRAYRI